MKLTPAVLASRTDRPLPDLVEVNCSNLEISHIDDISVCVNLHKLDLTNNAIKKADALSGIHHNKELTWLKLKMNKLESLEGVGTLTKLIVLDMSHNEINRISHHVSTCTNLKALILNNNKIARIENLNNLKQLATLVLSHNKLSSIDSLASLQNLTKLSIAHNALRAFPTTLTANPTLKELRLNDNKLLSIPDEIRQMPALEILDLGNNLISSIADVVNLASLHNLVNLNLKGNPLVAKSGEGYKDKVRSLVPGLRVLDGERFDEKFLKRKNKRAGKGAEFVESVRKAEKRRQGMIVDESDEGEEGTDAGKRKRARVEESVDTRAEARDVDAQAANGAPNRKRKPGGEEHDARKRSRVEEQGQKQERKQVQDRAASQKAPPAKTTPNPKNQSKPRSAPIAEDDFFVSSTDAAPASAKNGAASKGKTMGKGGSGGWEVKSKPGAKSNQSGGAGTKTVGTAGKSGGASKPKDGPRKEDNAAERKKIAKPQGGAEQKDKPNAKSDQSKAVGAGSGESGKTKTPSAAVSGPNAKADPPATPATPKEPAAPVPQPTPREEEKARSGVVAVVEAKRTGPKAKAAKVEAFDPTVLEKSASTAASDLLVGGWD
ncbi:hypothetical protein HDV00_010451 [Rhizophlyctis rosea]|nr:hypothetical protein HDV00_010451 [Rhizophlyctis rosea]